jgi:hypothetical protein
MQLSPYPTNDSNKTSAEQKQAAGFWDWSGSISRICEKSVFHQCD